MKERGMIFNGEMVRAVLNGRKTQTRRIVKVQPHAGVRNSVFVKSGLEDGHGRELVCPFGAVGDRLWVREAFRVMGRATDVARLMYKASERNSFTESTRTVPIDKCNKQSSYNWTPSIHMPRWASRITLEITGVRVERLQAIGEDSARSEGVKPVETAADNLVGGKLAFAELWASVYGYDGIKSWQANPWVWVIEFKRVEGEA